MDARPWCYDNIEDYDLDRASLPAALAARAACFRCPRFRTCRSDAETLIENGTPPQSQVLGGVAYGHDGRPREGRALVTYFNNRKPEKTSPHISAAS
ncbi:hypothetical protein GS896_27685 [Rhodococcus hoagii]|nr:hypothetical protein [Prescottella equi]MBM4654035.1 hypothetical protein [Prescottella equi]MBM4719702.1 hypothetical protein [Prescottella equi]NKR23499.1 hypothetical protein [Prescottella equi]NKT56347.1 hypothetical protein [Prescottella equi]